MRLTIIKYLFFIPVTLLMVACATVDPYPPVAPMPIVTPVPYPVPRPVPIYYPGPGYPYPVGHPWYGRPYYPY